jgi:nitrite reductase (NO-forming)
MLLPVTLSNPIRAWYTGVRAGERLALTQTAAAIGIIGLIAAILVGTVSAQSSTPAASVPQITPPPHALYNAQPPATPSGDTVDLQLTVKESLITIAPNVAYHAWTFNGTIPGPILRVRQGQSVHFTLKNDGKMDHSVDFHAAQTAPNVNYRTIAPGESMSYSWKANYPGVFMYHCGTPPAMEHMANGMYGAIIVDPTEGWSPAQEYVLVQSEFYTQKNTDGSYSLNQAKLMQAMPDIVVFNGYFNQYASNALTARMSQKVRFFVVNAGPSQFSAFHIVGAIFSDYYPDGNPTNHLRGDQTITVPPGGGAVVELSVPDPGTYSIVTHSFAAASSGALGTLSVAP